MFIMANYVCMYVINNKHYNRQKIVVVDSEQLSEVCQGNRFGGDNVGA